MILAAAAAFALASATFKAQGTLPPRTAYDRAGCTGANRSPELHWSGAPKGTRSFAVIAFDPDAQGGWYHWVVYNLPASTHALSEAAAIAPQRLGTTSWGDEAYGGPCPPPGKAHHYVFTVYALDVESVAGEHLTGPRLIAAIAHHTLARTSLTGLFQR